LLLRREEGRSVPVLLGFAPPFNSLKQTALTELHTGARSKRPQFDGGSGLVL